jgi:hypothetical protein
MGLFNRDYDRNYGYRGASRTGYDRDMGDRAEGTWESMKRGTREFFGMDNRYDRSYGNDRGMNSTYNRSTYGATGYGNRGGGMSGGGMSSNDRNFGNTGYGGGNAGFGGSNTGYGRSNVGYGTDYSGRGATGGYDQPYWGYDTWRYDDNYKSREQTDVGDPFGDRQSGTPIRVMDEPRDRDRGWFGGSDYDRNFRYDRGMRGYGGDYNNTGYGGDYRAANPMGYEPYDNRGGDSQRLGRPYDSGFRNRNYDREWF